MCGAAKAWGYTVHCNSRQSETRVVSSSFWLPLGLNQSFTELYSVNSRRLRRRLDPSGLVCFQ